MPMKLDFKAIAETVDIENVARHLALPLKPSGNELRCACPACGTEDPRSLAVYPESNSFRCYAAQLSGDCIALYAHINRLQGQYAAAKAVSEQFLTSPLSRNVGTVPNSSRDTAPQKPAGRTAQAQPAAAFDPNEYAAKLTFNEQVAALGLTEEDAARLQMGFASTGFHRGRVAIPLRDMSGQILGFMGWDGKDLKFPKQLLSTNVVPLKRPA